MIIKSPFKDYYDHVAYRYGQPDDTLTYVRDRLSPLKLQHVSHFASEKIHLNIEAPVLYNLSKFSEYRIQCLAVAGSYYFLAKMNTYSRQYEIIDQDKHQELYAKLTSKKFFGQLLTHSDLIDVDAKEIINISRTINAPVFIVNSHGWNWKTRKFELEVETEIPILSNTGLPKYLSADECYAKIEWFIANVLRDNPDTVPPVNVEDKYKITAHGFDNKSFKKRPHDIK